MKRIWISIFTLFIFTTANVSAQTIKMTVELLADFDSGNPPKTIKTRVLEDKIFNETDKIEAGCIFDGQVMDVVEAKRGKRSEYFYYRITSYTVPSKTLLVEVKNPNAIVKAMIYKPLDKKELAMSAGTSVAGLFVDHIAIPINFARGAIEQPYDEKNRFESGVQKAYEKSVISYVSKGKSMNLKMGDKINLVIKYDKQKNKKK